MRHPTRRTWTAAVAGAVLIALLAIAAGPALAKKPVKPPPEPPPQVDTGTIYSLAWTGSTFVVKTMDPDGSGQSYLASGVFPFGDAGAPCEPSTALHDGERWFLQLRDVGGGHREVFAVNESATVVAQLTDAPDLVVEPLSVGWPSCPRWAKRGDVVDGKVSYLAKKVSGDEVVEWGIYVLDVDPDDLADHEAAAPTKLPLSVILSPNGYINALYDWSPDGNSVVYRLPNPSRGLWKASGPAWTPTQLVSSDEDCRMPRWLAGNRILFKLYSTGGTESIAADGTDRQTVVAGSSSESFGWCFGSPNGTHVIHNVFYYNLKTKQRERDGVYEIVRHTVDGDDGTNLTGSSNDDQFPLGWR